MNLYDSKLYMRDVSDTAMYQLDWNIMSGKSVVISGGTGMIGSFLVDTIMYRNEHFNQNTDIYVIGRSKNKLEMRFCEYLDNSLFHAVCWDINQPANMEDWMDIDISYMIHAASNTHPVAYASDPIGTISANVIGTNNMLSLAAKCRCERFVFLSSVEIYGENRGDIDAFTEDYLGYIDCNTLRAGYPESKRTGEALCRAYEKQEGLSVVIPRLSRVYGPSMLLSDTKALSQFILKGVRREDIVLKSEGTQLFSYSYVADAVSAILKLMLEGADGEAYNIVSQNSDVQLKQIAQVIADYSGKRVVFELPDAIEAAGYSKATRAILDTAKIESLGWKSMYDMTEGLHHTIEVLREVM